MDQIKKIIREIVDKYMELNNHRRIVVALAALCVFVTTYSLVLPAITLEQDKAEEIGVKSDTVEQVDTGSGEEPAAEETAAEQDAASVETAAGTDDGAKAGTETGQSKTEEAKPDNAEPEEKDGSNEVKLLTKKKTITADKTQGGGFAVSAVVGADAKVPADVTLSATELDKDSEGFAYRKYYDEALAALKKESKDVKGISSIRFYDISLESESQGDEVEPDAPVSVKIECNEGIKVSDADQVRIVHFAENKNGSIEAKVLDNNRNKVEATIDENSAKLTEAEFETDGFSVYAVVGTETITEEIITADGSTYEVKVTYGPDAGIPEGAKLKVSELTEDSQEYADYKEQTADAVGSTTDGLEYIKLLDISIMDGDEKVEIEGSVDVEIRLTDKEKTKNRTKVVHFGDDAVDVIEPDVTGDVVKFEAAGFSYYAVTSYGETSNLNGKSFAIVQVNTQSTQTTNLGNDTVHQGRALQTTAQSSNTRLAGVTVNVEEHESGLNIVTSGTAQIEEWTFEETEGTNTYYIKSSDGRYLNLADNSLYLSDTPMALTVTAGTGNNAGTVRISNGTRRLQSSVSRAAARTANNNQYFHNGTSNDVNYVYMTLCQIEEFDPNAFPVYEGEKVSVQDLTDGQKCIIYKNIYNETSGEYEDWVIDGNGNAVKAYDQGDSLSMHSEVSPWWVLSILVDSHGQPTGYYIFRNEETGLILHPLADGTLVKEYDPATSPTTDGVALKGREGGAYTSTIEYWDSSAMAYYGYQFTTDGQVVLSSGTGDNSQAFSFAEEKPSQTGLHTVETVDSVAAGVTIHMFNYPNRATISNVTGSDSYAAGVLPKQHVNATLNADGYPQFTNGNNGSALFDPSNSYHRGTGNHLFLESVYDSTGYYEYSAFNNFAHYNNDGTFTVYQETGTPSPTASNFFYKRGNFFPYNNLNTNNSAQNIYTGDGTILDYENPSYGSKLYGLSGTVDYQFGMTMEFNFLMPRDGKEKGAPLIYEFNGDDDLWIYIDDVLILDIGGVHDAFPGSINFETGEITGGNGGAGGARTIKQCFKNAGVFPDGTAWDDSRVDEYFKGDTFISYGSHQFNMFYMEHGAGASNLQTRFNLPVIEKGKVTVEKKLDNTSQVDYANVKFAYQAFTKDDNGNYIPMTSAVYEGTTDPLTFYDDVVINGKSYDNVFYLKPEEAAVFSDMVEDQLYFVQELGIDPTYYDEIYVNDVKIDGEQVIAEDGVYKSTEATARNRARVTFTNHCDNRNSNELLITKRLDENSPDNGDTFEFRVMLEKADGVLSAYYQGTYYIRDDEGVYYRYQDGKLVPNGETPYACTAGNYGTIDQIPPDYTVVIKDLVAGTDFYVDEIRVTPNGSSSKVLIGDSQWKLTDTEVTDARASEISDATIWDYATERNITGASLGSIAWDKDAHVTFTNKYKSADVWLRKVKEDKTTTISGSVFDLAIYRNDTWSNNIQTDIRPGAEATATTPAVANPVDLGRLGTGKYRLTETKAPDGYLVLTKYIYFEVYEDNDAYKVRFIDEDGTPLTDAQIEELGDTAVLTSSAGEDGDVYTITAINTPGTELPHTGGTGTILYTICGIGLIMAAAALYGFRLRRRERRSN